MDIESITLGDIEEMEANGVSLTDLGSLVTLDVSRGQLPPAKVLAVAAWLASRDTHPERTIKDCKALKLSELTQLVSEIDVPGSAERD